MQTKYGPIPFEHLTAKQVRRGKKTASKLLRGVGGERTFFTTDPPGVAIHLQAPLTEAEIEQLPPGWMDIPAVDDRGPCRPL